MRKYRIIALIGESGSGKDTILKEMERVGEMYNFPLHTIISCTTRPKRENEINGVNYYYFSDEEFEDSVRNNEMLEFAEFNNWMYGTSINTLDINKINIGVFNPTGIELLLKRADVDVQVFYIIASAKTRLLRQLNREENPNIQEIIRRFQTDMTDFENIDFNYYSVFNPDDSAAIKQNAYQIISIGALADRPSLVEDMDEKD